MSTRDTASQYQLQQPQKLDKVVTEDNAQFEDCTPCRIMGASAFIGLGVYSYVSGSYQLRQQRASILQTKSMFGMRSRQAGITSISVILVGLGIYRLVR